MITWDESKRQSNIKDHGWDFVGCELGRKEPTKVLTTIRLDADVIEHFKAQGPGWQRRINDALRKAMGEP